MSWKINLISDTVTKPTQGMLEAMMNAEVGDDVFQEDPTVQQLEDRLAQMFGHEAGLFCPSGTMTNQIAIKAHTQPLDEMICDVQSHVYQYEVGGYAFHSQIAVNPILGDQGKLSVDLLRDQVKAHFDWLPRTKLVVLENTCNRAGGNYYALSEMQSIAEFCKLHQLTLHLDGARIFNAIVASEQSAMDIGPIFDSISICLSKGLGAPIGSVLIGNKSWIQYCRRIRKVMGGGMRQVGILAAAGSYALDHHILRLNEDHSRAKMIESALLRTNYVASVIPVITNIIIFNLIPELSPQSFIDQLRAHGINASAFGKQSVRFVTHLDIDDVMIDDVCGVLEKKIRC